MGMKLKRAIAMAAIALVSSAAMALGAHSASSVTNSAPYTLNLPR
jgi:predicted lipoprotein with Yx(FWY)xxD motif